MVETRTLMVTVISPNNTTLRNVIDGIIYNTIGHNDTVVEINLTKAEEM